MSDDSPPDTHFVFDASPPSMPADPIDELGWPVDSSGWPTYWIGNWDAFAAYVSGANSIGSVNFNVPTYIFRGQADSSWSLKSSLQRAVERLGSDLATIYQLEQDALSRFIDDSTVHLRPFEIMQGDDPVNWWMLMQHYGAPTRLLDWTASIYVAAYFACAAEPKKDGAIWLVHSHSLLGFSDTFARDMNRTAPWTFAATPPDAIHVLQRKRKFERVRIQQGLFTITDSPITDVTKLLVNVTAQMRLDDPMNIVIHKLIIPARVKYSFLIDPCIDKYLTHREAGWIVMTG
jgi:hypothetical protein